MQSLRYRTNNSITLLHSEHTKPCTFALFTNPPLAGAASLSFQYWDRECNCWFFFIYTTIGDACVCVFAKLDQFLPVRSHFDTKRTVNFFHIATFPSPTFGPLFAFHCPLFFTKNNNLQWCDVLKSNGDYPM